MAITSEQVRAARALLRWEQKQLADVSGVSLPSIKRLETQAGALAAQGRTSDAIQRALEAAGVEFIPENGGGPGVRLKKRGAVDHPMPVGPATDAFASMEDAVAQDRGKASRGRGKRLASIKEQFERADKKPMDAAIEKNRTKRKR